VNISNDLRGDDCFCVVLYASSCRLIFWVYSKNQNRASMEPHIIFNNKSLISYNCLRSLAHYRCHHQTISQSVNGSVSTLTHTHIHNRTYEGGSVNRSQMDINRKKCYILTWKKHLFLDISSTNTDTLVPSLYQCVETRNREVF
jgi:hypothetical protein